MFSRQLQRLSGRDGHAALAVAQCQSKRRSGGGFQGGRDRHATNDLLARVGLFEPPADFGIIGLPDDRAGSDAVEIDRASSEGQLQIALAREYFEDAPPLLVLIGPALIEDDAVARFERLMTRVERHSTVGADAIDAHDYPAAGDVDDGSDANSAGFGKEGGNQFGVIDAVEEAVGETAGEYLRQIALL